MKIKTKIEEREPQNYMAINSKVQRGEIPDILPPLIPEVLDWMKNNQIEPAGPPFFRYLKMEGNLLEVEVGIPVASAFAGNDRIKPGIIPGGRYAVATYFGHYKNLYQAHTTLESWGKDAGLKLKGPRTEFYPNDPKTETDPENWQTDITILVDDQ